MRMIDTVDMTEVRQVRLPFTNEQLLAFVAVLDNGNVTRAAESIHLSQSTVSHHLRVFQQALGLKLFEQVGRDLRPTDACREFAATARAAVRTLVGLTETAASLSNSETGLLRVGASQTTVSYYLPSILADFLHDRPGLSVHVVAGNTVQVCDWVATAEVDLGLIEGPLASGRVVEQRLIRDEVVMVVANGHPLTMRRQFSRRDLLTTRYVAREVGSGTELVAEAMLGDLYPVIPRVQLGQLDAVRAAVLAGVGFAALPRVAVNGDIESGLLAVLPIRRRSRWIRAIRRPTAAGPATEALWQLLATRFSKQSQVSGTT